LKDFRLVKFTISLSNRISSEYLRIDEAAIGAAGSKSTSAFQDAVTTAAFYLFESIFSAIKVNLSPVYVLFNTASCADGAIWFEQNTNWLVDNRLLIKLRFYNFYDSFPILPLLGAALPLFAFQCFFDDVFNVASTE
jgi:hypothetical protein